MSFQRPGSRSTTAFGVAFSSSASDGRPWAGPGSGRGNDGDDPRSASGGGGGGNARPPPAPLQQQQRPGAHLPAARYRRQILFLVESHATVILVGETGSGKTTQVPQFLFDAGWADGGAQVRGAGGAGAAVIVLVSVGLW